MESEDEDMFHEKRCEYRGGVADQGTEQGHGDDTIKVVHGFATYQTIDDLMNFLYPYLLMLPGMLHAF